MSESDRKTKSTLLWGFFRPDETPVSLYEHQGMTLFSVGDKNGKVSEDKYVFFLTYRMRHAVEVPVNITPGELKELLEKEVKKFKDNLIDHLLGRIKLEKFPGA